MDENNEVQEISEEQEDTSEQSEITEPGPDAETETEQVETEESASEPDPDYDDWDDMEDIEGLDDGPVYLYETIYPFGDGPDGAIVIKHEITIGDVIVSTILLALLIYHVLDRLIRR